MLIAYDTFTGTAGTVLGAHVGDVQTQWASGTYNASVAVLTNANRVRSTQALQAIYQTPVPTNVADCDVFCDMYVADLSVTNAAIRLIARATSNESVFYMAGYDLNNAASGAGRLELYSASSGGFTAIGTPVAYTVTAGSTYRLWFSLRGTQLTISISSDGGVTYPTSNTHSDTNISAAGYQGFQLFGACTDSTGLHVDNFKVLDYYAFPTPTITADDSHLLYSGTWNVSGVGVASRAKTINSGNTIEAFIAPTQAVSAIFDVSGMASLSAPTLWIEFDSIGSYYTIPSNGVVPITVPSINSISVNGVASVQHSIKIFSEGVYEGNFANAPQGAVDEWTQQFGGVNFQGFVTSGATIAFSDSRPLMRFTGDSLTASVHCLRASAGDGQNVMAAHLYWPSKVSSQLGFRPIIAGFGSQGVYQNNNQQNWNGNASGNVPTVANTYGNSFSGVTYTPISAPLVEVVALGSNDNFWLSGHSGSMTGAQFQAAYLSLLQQIRLGNPTGYIFCVAFAACSGYTGYAIDLRPFIQAAITQSADTRTYFLDYSSVYTSADTNEGIHFSTGGSNKIAARLTADIASQLSSNGVKMQPSVAGSYALNGTLTLM